MTACEVFSPQDPLRDPAPTAGGHGPPRSGTCWKPPSPAGDQCPQHVLSPVAVSGRRVSSALREQRRPLGCCPGLTLPPQDSWALRTPASCPSPVSSGWHRDQSCAIRPCPRCGPCSLWGSSQLAGLGSQHVSLSEMCQWTDGGCRGTPVGGCQEGQRRAQLRLVCSLCFLLALSCLKPVRPASPCELTRMGPLGSGSVGTGDSGAVPVAPARGQLL